MKVDSCHEPGFMNWKCFILRCFYDESNKISTTVSPVSACSWSKIGMVTEALLFF